MLAVASASQKASNGAIHQRANLHRLPKNPTSIHQTDTPFTASRRVTFLQLSSGFLLQSLDVTSWADTLSESPPPESDQVYLDIAVDGQSFGRVAIEVYDDVPVGGQRFLDLAIGRQGIRYRSTKFIRLMKDYIENGGVRRLSLVEGMESPIAGGDSLQELLKELDAQRHLHDKPGLVSLILKRKDLRPSTKKLVAVKGKLETVEEGGEIGPNGTGFIITNAAVPSLDETHLVVGRVVFGMDVVERLIALPTFKDNTGSVFYQTAQRLGDQRADIAAQSFSKPVNRITISNSGRL